MGGLLHLVQRGGERAGCGPTQAPPRCTKCKPTRQRPVYQSLYCYMMVRCSAVLMWRLKDLELCGIVVALPIMALYKYVYDYDYD